MGILVVKIFHLTDPRALNFDLFAVFMAEILEINKIQSKKDRYRTSRVSKSISRKIWMTEKSWNVHTLHSFCWHFQMACTSSRQQLDVKIEPSNRTCLTLGVRPYQDLDFAYFCTFLTFIEKSWPKIIISQWWWC